jgi:hypothetical protein
MRPKQRIRTKTADQIRASIDEEHRKAMANRKAEDGQEVEESDHEVLSSAVLGSLSSRPIKKTKLGKKTDKNAAVEILDDDVGKKSSLDALNLGAIMWGKSQRVQLAGVHDLAQLHCTFFTNRAAWWMFL